VVAGHYGGTDLLAVTARVVSNTGTGSVGWSASGSVAGPIDWDGTRAVHASGTVHLVCTSSGLDCPTMPAATFVDVTWRGVGKTLSHVASGSWIADGVRHQFRYASRARDASASIAATGLPWLVGVPQQRAFLQWDEYTEKAGR
jgi:hypothetical protein